MLKSTISRIHSQWMRLDPSQQFMFWSTCGVIVPGLLFALFALIAMQMNTFSVGAMTGILAVGVVLFFGVFLAAVIFLTVIWPHRYQAERKRLKKNDI